MSEWGWLKLAEWAVRLAQGELAYKPHTIINDLRAIAGWALTRVTLACLRRSDRAAERRGELEREGGRGEGERGSKSVRGASDVWKRA